MKDVPSRGRAFGSRFFEKNKKSSDNASIPHAKKKYELRFLVRNLKKCWKEKSCFHVKELTPGVKKKIAALLKEGYALYKKGKFVP